MRLRKMVTGALLVGLGAVGGPSIAMAAINASNHGTDVDAKTGNATSVNQAASAVGGTNQNGDNHDHTGQAANALTGDANAGQVVGQVGGGSGTGTGGGMGSGTGSINASNSCDDCTSKSGDANSVNQSASAVGGTNQNGDNHDHTSQTSSSQSGDANSGQVIGQVNP
jgi:hypothetical protein